MQLQKISKIPPQKGLEFPEGWGVLEKIPSMGEVWIFSGITQYENRIGLRKQLHCMWSVEVGNITREALKDKL